MFDPGRPIDLGQDARNATYKTCLKDKVRDRVRAVNHRRDDELKRNILGSVAPSPLPAPLGWFSPAAMAPGGVVLPDQTDEQLSANFLIGMWSPEDLGPIGAGANILVAGAMEGSYGYYNHRKTLARAKAITAADKKDCLREANNQ